MTDSFDQLSSDRDDDEDEVRNEFSEIFNLVFGDPAVLTLENVRMLGGEPIEERELEGLPEVAQTAFRYLNFSLDAMLRLNLPPCQIAHFGKHDERLSEMVRGLQKEYLEIVVRLTRVRMRREIQTLKSDLEDEDVFLSSDL